MAPKDNDTTDRADIDSSANPSSESSTTIGTEPKRPLRRYIAIGLLAVVGPLAAILLGVYIYLSGGRHISTDNAYVKSAKIAVSADISGRVTEVAVRENQTVEPGSMLFQIDPAQFQISHNRAEAQLLAARQAVEALRAVYQRKFATLKLSQGEVAFHRRMLDRQKKLSRKKLVSGLNLDNAIRNLRNAKDRVQVAQQDLAEARANLGGNPAIKTESHPSVLEARALRDRAALNLKNTAVRAIMRGIVTNFDLQRGEYVKAGNPIFSLVGTDNTWIHANYKETELTHVRVGQRAKISVDTYPGKTFGATVAGISPATGAEFSVLPPQNATGNWVKVVQRLTVRLKLDQPDDNKAKLRAGMSAIVEIDTGHRRKLTGVFAIVADWARDFSKGIL